jgi:glyoxylase-like metal-dependent hydrolase (beta-lactamase superfamily II)
VITGAAHTVAIANRRAAARPPRLDGADAVITFVGHATFLIQTAAGNILTDPMYSQRAGPVNAMGPRRVRQPAVRFDDLPPISIVLLSHNHCDHCDLRSLRMLAERCARFPASQRRRAPAFALSASARKWYGGGWTAGLAV